MCLLSPLHIYLKTKTFCVHKGLIYAIYIGWSNKFKATRKKFQNIWAGLQTLKNLSTMELELTEAFKFYLIFFHIILEHPNGTYIIIYQKNINLYNIYLHNIA